MNEFEHNFVDSLARSHAADTLPFWRECYEKAFPTMAAMVNHREDGDHQRAGIDRSVILHNSKQILIDEKVRDKNRKTGKIYHDIALEFWSDFDRRVPGWVCKPLLADYIAYAIAPLGKCYLLPVPQMQAAWERNKAQWVHAYFIAKAPNRTRNRQWVTYSCCVPPDVLFREIGRCLRVEFEPFDMEEAA